MTYTLWFTQKKLTGKTRGVVLLQSLIKNNQDTWSHNQGYGMPIMAPRGYGEEFDPLPESSEVKE